MIAAMESRDKEELLETLLGGFRLVLSDPPPWRTLSYERLHRASYWLSVLHPEGKALRFGKLLAVAAEALWVAAGAWAELCAGREIEGALDEFYDRVLMFLLLCFPLGVGAPVGATRPAVRRLFADVTRRRPRLRLKLSSMLLSLGRVLVRLEGGGVAERADGRVLENLAALLDPADWKAVRSCRKG